MVVATVSSIIGFAFVGLTASIGLIVVGVLFCGLGSALGSGPLEAWYVDRAGEHGDVDTMPAFTSAAVVSNVAVAVGAVIAAVVPSLFDSLPERGSAAFIQFTPVFAAAILCMVIRLVVVLAWMDDDSRRHAASTASGWDITRQGTLSVARDDGLRRLFAVMVGVGMVSVTFDIVVPLALENDPSIARPNAVFAVLFGLSMLGTAAGAAIAPRVAGAGSDNKRSTGLVSMFCGAAALTALVPGSLGLILGYFLLWTCSGPLMPVFQAALHERVDTRQRATVVSAMSLATMAGAGAAAGLVSVLDSFLGQRQLLAGAAGLMIFAGLYATGGSTSVKTQAPSDESPSDAIT
jgi:MFS family permease